MSQNDYVIGNQSAPNFRSDLNDSLQALASLSSGSTAPSTTYANMLWYDTGNNILKMRTEADDAWINIAYLDQSANAFRLLDDTQVTDTSGTQTGLLGDQATSVWEAGTGTTESLVSPAKVKAAIEALAPQGFGEEVAAGTDIKYSDTNEYNTSGQSDFVVLSANLLGGGSVRVSFEASRGGFTSGNTVEISVGGSVVFSETYADVGYTADSVDVSFTEYQRLIVTTSGGNGFRNLTLGTTGVDLLGINLPGGGVWQT